MAKTPTLKVTGVAEVVDAFDQFGEDATSSNMGDNAARKIASDVERNTRKLTGELSKSWTHSDDGEGGFQFENPLDYAIVQEFGSEDITGTFAVANAFAANAAEVESAYQKGLVQIGKKANIDTQRG